MKDGGGLDQGGDSRRRKKCLHSLCALMVKPTDSLMDWRSSQEGKKARNDSKGFGSSSQKDGDATYGGGENCKR